MKATKLVILFSLILAVSACNTRKRDRNGVKKPVTTLDKTTGLSYELGNNTCNTKQQFNSNQELCDGLQNATLNKGCALEKRKKKFAEKCKNQIFTETNPYIEEPTTVRPSPGVTEKSSSLVYDYSEDGCETGRHEFKTRDELCVSLKDNSLNKGCALEKREARFKEENCKL